MKGPEDVTLKDLSKEEQDRHYGTSVRAGAKLLEELGLMNGANVRVKNFKVGSVEVKDSQGTVVKLDKIVSAVTSPYAVPIAKCAAIVAGCFLMSKRMLPYEPREPQFTIRRCTSAAIAVLLCLGECIKIHEKKG